MEVAPVCGVLVGHAFKIVQKGLKHTSTFQAVVSKMKDLALLVEQMDRSSEEISELMRKIEATQKVIRKCSEIYWYNFYRTRFYRKKLKELDQSLDRCISVQLQVQMARKLKVIQSKLSSDDSHSSQITLAAETLTSYGSPTFKGDFEIPEPEFTVELCDPLDELKFDVNLSCPAGSGKTTLVDMASSSSSASCQFPKKYDVFISFRGEDTRSNFTSHLYDALHRNKIETYIDNRLRKGDKVWPSLVKAIEESTLFLIVFSQNYASSTWCLSELTKILEYSKDQGLPVIPVFYNIDPSHVRKQTGSYQAAFSKHERTNHNYQHIQKWRAALTEAANLSGWDSSAYRNEAQLIKQIVTFVMKSLDTMFPSIYSDGLFGIHEQII